MKMQGRIKNQLLIILDDSGITRNFLDYTVAKRWSCELKTIKGLQEIVANGNTILAQEACKDLKWEVQGLQQQTDFFILPLQGCDLVLGVQCIKPWALLCGISSP